MSGDKLEFFFFGTFSENIFNRKVKLAIALSTRPAHLFLPYKAFPETGKI